MIFDLAMKIGFFILVKGFTLEDKKSWTKSPGFDAVWINFT